MGRNGRWAGRQALGLSLFRGQFGLRLRLVLGLATSGLISIMRPITCGLVRSGDARLFFSFFLTTYNLWDGVGIYFVFFFF